MARCYHPSVIEGDFLSKRPSARAVLLISIGLFIFAFLVRLQGITWGLPKPYRHQSLHPDELLIAQTVDAPYFRPGFYNYGTLYLTVLKLATDMGQSYGWVRKPVNVNADTPFQYLIADAAANWKTYRDIHLTGRVLSSLAGSAAVAIAFVSILYFGGLLGALCGALALLIAPAHVVHSRFQTTDIFAAMMISVVLFLCLRLISAPKEKLLSQAIVCGMVLGLAAGTKYTGLLLLPSLLLALWFNDRGRFVKLSLFAIASCMAGFLLATPGILLEPSQFWSGFLFEVEHVQAGHGIVFAETANGFIFHAVNLVQAFGLLPLVFALIGLVWAVAKRERWAMVAMLFAVLYYIAIGRAEVKFLRYVFPLLPVLALGIGYLVNKFHERGGYFRALPAAILLALGYSVVSLQGVAQMTSFMSAEDPRDASARWLNSKRGTVGLVSDPWFYSPPLFPDIGLLDSRFRMAAMAQNPRLLRYGVDWDPKLITAKRPDYIVFSSFEFLDNDRINLPNLDAFIRELDNGYSLAAIFWGREPIIATTEDRARPITRQGLRAIFTSRFPLLHDMMYIQPTICVFQKK